MFSLWGSYGKIHPFEEKKSKPNEFMQHHYILINLISKLALRP
jgi:hypothetical protein